MDSVWLLQIEGNNFLKRQEDKESGVGEDKPLAKVLGYRDHAPSPLAAVTRQEKQN